ncbi:hypothetical protein X737_30615 [Mesorhizobium sp. L48C026A00]|nr:hypothetical protein X737_30615 [Mesorhizobium sp. L48C026A00]
MVSSLSNAHPKIDAWTGSSTADAWGLFDRAEPTATVAPADPSMRILTAVKALAAKAPRMLVSQRQLICVYVGCRHQSMAPLRAELAM